MEKKELRIVFMGTPDFAVESLRQLVENGFRVVGVITNVDKPAGRGRKLLESPVKKYAQEQGLKLLQPPKLKAPDFIDELKSLNPDLGIVVAFRMLPELVWNMPKLGTFNLHASLLPQYRGAAPINWAIMNGETKTGISTFFLQHEIDTGKIIFRKETRIGPTETAGQLHDKLMTQGGKLVVNTVEAILQNDYPQIDQAELLQEGEEIKQAPKIFKENCQIDWSNDVAAIHNHIRGLSPYPAAWTELVDESGNKTGLKVYAVEKEISEHELQSGTILSDSKKWLKVAVKGGYIEIKELQQAGKKRMFVEDFLRGFQGDWNGLRFN